MVADTLTKSLPSPAFIEHRKVIPFSLKILGGCLTYMSTHLCSTRNFFGGDFFGLLNLDTSTPQD